MCQIGNLFNICKNRLAIFYDVPTGSPVMHLATLALAGEQVVKFETRIEIRTLLNHNSYSSNLIQ